jgi:hypothetical protein
MGHAARKGRKVAQGDAEVARAVAAALGKRDARPWTLVQYVDADWSHGYCSGDRLAAWKGRAAKLTRIRPPARLPLPFAQFAIEEGGKRVLVESTRREGEGRGVVAALAAAKQGLKLGMEEMLWER